MNSAAELSQKIFFFFNGLEYWPLTFLFCRWLLPAGWTRVGACRIELEKKKKNKNFRLKPRKVEMFRSLWSRTLEGKSNFS